MRRVNRDREVKVVGYKLNGYNAMYEKVTFGISKRNVDSESCVLEICDINSGVTYIVDVAKSITEGKDKYIYEQCDKEVSEIEKDIRYIKQQHQRAEDNSRNTGKQRFTKRNGGKFIAYYGTSGNRECGDDAERND